MRGRSYSYSPSPPRDYERRYRSPSPRYHRYGDRGRDLPTSLLVRNLRHDCRPEDLHGPFGRFGRIKDVYLPRDYYTGEPRGFGFVQYIDPADATDAKYHIDGYVLLGRELTVLFAEENRKKPSEMRARERSSDRGGLTGALLFAILDPHTIKVILAVQTNIPLHLVTLGQFRPEIQGTEKDLTQGQFHQETQGTEKDLTQGRLIIQGAKAEALVGARAGAWSIVGDTTN